MALQIGQEATRPDFTNLAVLRSDPRLAVRNDSIVCLICGGQFRQLTNTHLRAHGTGVIEYKIRFGYNRRRALMSRQLRRLYTERAVGSGLAAHIRHRPIIDAPELRRRGGVRPIALEERLTRREAQRQALAARRARRSLVAQAAEKRPLCGGTAPSAARSTYRQYASRAAVGRRLASGPF